MILRTLKGTSRVYLRWTPPTVIEKLEGIIGTTLGSSYILFIPLLQGGGSSKGISQAMNDPRVKDPWFQPQI